MPEQDHRNPLVGSQEELPSLAPPSPFIWLLSGMFLLLILGGVVGIVVFRNVLRPGQQQRIVNVLPFTAAFLPVQSNSGIGLPTPEPAQQSAISPDELLNLSLADVSVEMPTATFTLEAAVPQITQTAITVSILPTLEATLTLQATSTPTVNASPSPTAVSRPQSHHLYGFTWTLQTWNNCGPASITIALSYFGWAEGQEIAAAFLKPDDEDKNVTRVEMAAFVNEQTQVRAITRMGGNMELLKRLVADGFPVVISTGFMPAGEDWLGHYQTVVGFDDYQQIFYVYDSFLGTGENNEGIRVPYEEFDQNWQQFNRDFIVVFSQESDLQVQSLLGELSDPRLNAELTLEAAQAEARAEPQNGFAWFNIGTALVALNRYEEAATAFDQARRLDLPWRMLWYQFGPYVAYFEVGRYGDVLSLTSANLNNGGSYVEETYYWQGRAYAAQGEEDEAVNAFRQALAHNPSYDAAQEALDSLEP